MTENELIRYFLTKFYDVCATTDSFNTTLDEFYDQFPVEMHKFLLEFTKNTQNEVKNG